MTRQANQGQANQGQASQGQASQGQAQAALSAAQRGLVEANLGLVALHIRRNVRNLGAPRFDRDFDDLFQEGCCGLIQAVRTYDPARGIPFPVYALPRIHTAVSTALHGAASLVKVPRRRRPCRTEDRAGAATAAAPPKVYALEDEPVARRHETPKAEASCRTVGDRLRDKYDVAVDVASRRAAQRKSRRADRGHLVGRLVKDRFRVAEPEAKTALREIARTTGSSYSRVLQCERRLKEGVRRALAGDLEFLRLVKLLRVTEEGHECVIDASLDEELRRLAGEGFWRKLTALEEGRQGHVLIRLLREMGEGLEATVKALFASLPHERADNLLRMVSDGS